MTELFDAGATRSPVVSRRHSRFDVQFRSRPMTDKKDPPTPGSPAGSTPASTPASTQAADAGGKRPHATLDLKATEVKGAEAPAGAKAPGDPASPVKPARADAASPSGKDGAPGAKQTAPTPPPAAAARTGSGLGRLASHLVAGLAGGAIVLFGGEKLAQTLGLPTPGAQQAVDRTALETRLAAVETAAKADPSAMFAPLADRLHRLELLAGDVADIKAQQETLSAEAKALGETLAKGSDTTVLDQRLAKLESQLATLESAAGSEGSGGRIPQLAAVTGKISDLETALAAQIAELRQTVPQNLEQRFAVLGETSEAAKSGAMRLDRDLTQTRTDVARLSQRIETLSADTQRIQTTVQAAQEETGRIASGLGEMRGVLEQQSRTFAKATDVAAAVTPVTGLISKLEGSLEGVLKSEEERRSSAERIVVSLELANLKRAVERGQGFASELEAVRTASGGKLQLGALDRYKADGVPTLAVLQADGRLALDAALDAGRVPETASVWDRLMAGAKSVVRVRKMEPSSDETSAEALVARIEAALAAGRLGAVLQDVGKLSPAAQATLAGWRDKVAARVSIEDAIAETESELKAALVPAGAAPAAVEAGSGDGAAPVAAPTSVPAPAPAPAAAGNGQ